MEEEYNEITEEDKQRLEDMEWWDRFYAGGLDYANKLIGKKMEKMIFPSCSSIVWKLNVPNSTKIKILKALENKKDKNRITTYMGGDFPNKFLGIMIDYLKEKKSDGYDLKDIKLKMVRNDEGEEWGFIREGFKLAKLCLNKEMGRREAKKILEKHFDEEQERELSEEEDEE